MSAKARSLAWACMAALMAAMCALTLSGMGGVAQGLPQAASSAGDSGSTASGSHNRAGKRLPGLSEYDFEGQYPVEPEPAPRRSPGAATIGEVAQERRRVERGALEALGRTVFSLDYAKPIGSHRWAARVKVPGREGGRVCDMEFTFQAGGTSQEPQLEYLRCSKEPALGAAGKSAIR